ncbi:hypothetical protein A2775_02820 [Candidatus Curtissbacteria bacterium RIFCSPHIGHO2_01_FULL_39_57]|nr:MAG: hypothetical protein A2775_02820 [Candidatus Curtissbacteria bacterium RIFCSPHIGHO2_01_FULL_39_57]
MKRKEAFVKNPKKSPQKKYPLYFKVLIPIVTLVLLELIARGLSVTILKDYLGNKDLRTKIEKVYIPPPEPSNEDVLRLYFYGASTTVGFPVPKVSYVNQLSYQLHNVLKNKNVDVKNLGWSGFTSTMDRYSIVSTFWHKPDAMIVYVSHNEFVHSEIDTLSLYRTISIFRDKSVLFRLLLAASQGNKKPDSPEDNEEPIERKRVSYKLVGPYYWIKMAILKKNYKAIAELSRDYNIPLIFITATSNVGEWPPPEKPVTYFTPSDKSYTDLTKVRALLKNNQLDEAQEITKYHLEKNPEDAYFLFMQAQIEEIRGNLNQARYNFEKAKDQDLLQWRANREINEFVRTLEDGKTVRVLDAEEIFKKHSPNMITGYPLFLDNVHPNIEGHYLLASSIIDLLKKDKIVERDWWENAKAPFTLEELLKEMQVSQDDEFQLAFITAVYCIKNPFFNFECALGYLEKAEKIKPGD